MAYRFDPLPHGQPDMDDQYAWHHEDDNNGMMALGYLIGAAAVSALALIVAVVVFVLASSGMDTGPGCPGADPAWIGFCNAAPEAR